MQALIGPGSDANKDQFLSQLADDGCVCPTGIHNITQPEQRGDVKQQAIHNSERQNRIEGYCGHVEEPLVSLDN